MGSFEETFKGLLAQYGRKYHRADIAEVISYEQVTRYGGYCETCEYEDIVVEVTYRSTSGRVETFDTYGSMASLIEDLSAFDREAE